MDTDLLSQMADLSIAGGKGNEAEEELKVNNNPWTELRLDDIVYQRTL